MRPQFLIARIRRHTPIPQYFLIIGHIPLCKRLVIPVDFIHIRNDPVVSESGLEMRLDQCKPLVQIIRMNLSPDQSTCARPCVQSTCARPFTYGSFAYGPFTYSVLVCIRFHLLIDIKLRGFMHKCTNRKVLGTATIYTCT